MKSFGQMSAKELAVALELNLAKVRSLDLTRDCDWYRSLPLSSEKLWDEQSMMVMLALA
jgi:hypothetical protein